jgi:phage shock protein E
MSKKRMLLLASVLVVGMITSCAGSPHAGEAPARLDYTQPANLAALIESGTQTYKLLDVRTPAEYASGHIPTSQNIPYDQLAARPPSWDRSTLVVTYCASGHRAQIAKETLEKLGFRNVVNFGGVGKWEGDLLTGD